jgi:hypothetical protein
LGIADLRHGSSTCLEVMRKTKHLRKNSWPQCQESKAGPPGYDMSASNLVFRYIYVHTRLNLHSFGPSELSYVGLRIPTAYAVEVMGRAN